MAARGAPPEPRGGRRLLGAVALAVWGLVGAAGCAPAGEPAPAAGTVPIALLGDSNTHAYQDRITFRAGTGARGGAYQSQTFQWIEVLARLRAGVIDPGPWETGGQNRLLATFGQRMNLPGARAPRKQDYRFNAAVSGATCRELLHGPRRQVQPLLAAMAPDAARWRQGVVVIRIGNVPMTPPDFLDGLALDAAAPAEVRVIDECLSQVEQAVALIRAEHPQTHIVLVGVFDDSNDPLNFERWHSRTALDNIARGLDRYDDGLRDLAARTPHASFFDDRAWFRAVWGGRDAQGRPDYRTVRVGDRLEVTMSLGDAPSHALVEDDHWGLVGNVQWAQAMSRHLASVGLPVKPIDDAEAQGFIEAQLRRHAPAEEGGR